MKPETLKRIINCFNSAGRSGEASFVKIRRLSTGSLITTHTIATICNIIVEDAIDDCVIHISKLDRLKAILKEYKKEEVPMSEFKNIAEKAHDSNYPPTDDAMKDAFINRADGFSIDFKLLESVYKSMKNGKSNVIRIDRAGDKILVSNESGDVSLVGLFKS